MAVMASQYGGLVERLLGEAVDALDRGVTLGPHWYTDPAIFDVEQETVFAHSWQYAGHISQVSEPGDHFACRAGRTPIIVLRDLEGELRAFVNVCRHRGHEIVRGKGARKTLQCHYHGWVYNLDGTLRSAPRSEREPAFDKTAYPLFPARVETWGPLVFVNPDMEAEPLSEAMRGASDKAVSMGLDLDRLELRDRTEYPCNCNWKVMLDNMLECYHCPTGHPGFYQYYDIDAERYEIEIYRGCSYQRGNLRPSEEAQQHKTDWGDFELYYIWPNTILIPGPVSCIVLPMIPVSTNRSVLVAETYVLPGVEDRVWKEYVEYYDEIWHEDVGLIESVQRGQESGRIPFGPLLADSERLIQQVQGLLVESLEKALERGAPTPTRACDAGS
jgi:phenylpropionate dioxygenase-like ring-hydroxylating dioxygenase large terminal subunit